MNEKSCNNMLIGICVLLIVLFVCTCFFDARGKDVRDQRGGADAARDELERAIDYEQRATRETRELAGEAENLGDELGTVREKLEDARREVGLVVEGNDRADSLIGECQQIIAGVRARGTKGEESN